MKLPAALIFLACAAPAPAAVVYSGLRNIAIPATPDGVYLDLDTGGISSTLITGWDINIFFGGVAISGSADFQPVRSGTGNEDPVQRLDGGTLIVSTLPYATGENGSSTHLGAPGNFQDGVEGYLGFRFTKNDASGPFYGWMRVTLTANTPGAVIRDWAWESSGSSIAAGQVPEPSPCALVAGGLALGLLRRVRAGKRPLTVT